MALYTETADAGVSVGELVVERPSRSRVFEQFGIDYCCGGRKKLDEACRDRQVDPQVVLRELRRNDEQRTPERDWAAMSLSRLADHIEQTHHAYLRQELPRLDFLTRKVVAAHGKSHPELVQLREVFLDFKAELLGHMQKEEAVMFPLCRRLDRDDAGVDVADCLVCGVDAPVRVLTHEHEDAGRALATMRQLTHDFTAPPEACTTYRALFDALEQLEADMHQHVHLENNILFPRAVDLWHGLAARASARGAQ